MPRRLTRRAKPSIVTAVAIIAVAVVVAAVVAIVGAGSDSRIVIIEARPNGDPEVPFVFDPPAVEVEIGTTVRWVNRSRTFHTVTFTSDDGRRVSNGTFDQSMFEVGDTIERTFTEAGDYHFFCQPHVAFMAGTVIVEPSGT